MKKRLTIFAVISLLLLVVIIILIYRQGNTATDQSIADSKNLIPATQIDTETQTTEQDSQYAFSTEEVTVKIPNLSHEYTLAWISDLHIISDQVAGDVLEDSLVTVKQRYDGLAITSDGVHSADLWPQIVQYLNSQNFDGIIMGGDILDYCSHSNISLLKQGYDQLKAPVLYVRSDHDYGAWYGGDTFTKKDAKTLQASIDGDDPSKKYLDFSEFLVVGINNSNKDMSEKQFSIIQSLYQSGKPVITVTHVPYASNVDPSLSQLSMQVHNSNYYWGGIYTPDTITQQYLNLIYDKNTPVKEVLAGHLHAKWDGMISAQVEEHIFTPALQGVIGVVHVVPE